MKEYFLLLLVVFLVPSYISAAETEVDTYDALSLGFSEEMNRSSSLEREEESQKFLLGESLVKDSLDTWFSPIGLSTTEEIFTSLGFTRLVVRYKWVLVHPKFPSLVFKTGQDFSCLIKRIKTACYLNETIHELGLSDYIEMSPEKKLYRIPATQRSAQFQFMVVEEKKNSFDEITSQQKFKNIEEEQLRAFFVFLRHSRIADLKPGNFLLMKDTGKIVVVDTERTHADEVIFYQNKMQDIFAWLSVSNKKRWAEWMQAEFEAEETDL